MRFSWIAGHAPETSGVEIRRLPDGSTAYLWAKGYFFDTDGRMFYGKEIADWLASRLPGTNLRSLLPQMNGCFALLAANEQEGIVILAADRLATVPVFLTTTGPGLVVSDDFWSIAATLETASYDPLGLTGMMLMSHTLGPRTMLEPVRTLAPASITTYQITSGSQSQETYWSNEYRPRPVADYALLRQNTAEMLIRVFERYTRAVLARDWTVTVALSGGLDSRLAAALLRAQGADLHTFSYGPPDSAETVTAAQVASALGTSFALTTIDDPSLISSALIQTQTRTVGMLTRFTTGFGARVSLDGYQPNMVYITGHPANLPTGQATPRGATLLRSTYQNARMIINNFGMPVSDAVLQRILPKTYSIEQKFCCFADGPAFQPADPLASYEQWTYYFHCTSLLLQEMRTYEDFGHWMLPYMDYELIDFYNTVPLRYRFLRRLHVDAIVQHIFTGDLAPLKHILISKTSRLRSQGLNLRDLVWMAAPPSPAGDALLRRQDAVQRRDQERKRGKSVPAAWGPDPIDFWWQTRPAFRESVLQKIRAWDGLGGLVDVDAVQQVLREPMHPNFIRFGIATLLTLQTFQELVETCRRARDRS